MKGSGFMAGDFGHEPPTGGGYSVPFRRLTDPTEGPTCASPSCVTCFPPSRPVPCWRIQRITDDGQAQVGVAVRLGLDDAPGTRRGRLVCLRRAGGHPCRLSGALRLGGRRTNPAGSSAPPVKQARGAVKHRRPTSLGRAAYDPGDFFVGGRQRA